MQPQLVLDLRSRPRLDVAFLLRISSMNPACHTMVCIAGNPFLMGKHPVTVGAGTSEFRGSYEPVCWLFWKPLAIDCQTVTPALDWGWVGVAAMDSGSGSRANESRYDGGAGNSIGG